MYPDAEQAKRTQMWRVLKQLCRLPMAQAFGNKIRVFYISGQRSSNKSELSGGRNISNKQSSVPANTHRAKENICRAGFAHSQRLEPEWRPSVVVFIHSAQLKATWEVHEEMKSVDRGIGALPFKKSSFCAEGRQV